MSKSNQKVIAAIDAGFEETKWARPADWGKQAALDELLTGGIPSAAVVPPSREIAKRLGLGRETVLITVDEQTFEVGPDVRMALSGSASGQTTNNNWIGSSMHKALYVGALHYMQAPEFIDVLVVGLPVCDFTEANIERLTKALKQTHDLPNEKSTTIKGVLVLPQPWGGFAYLAGRDPQLLKEVFESDAISIVIDPGHNTLDWLLVATTPRGTQTILDARSDGVANAGMVCYLQAVSDAAASAAKTSPGPLHRVGDALRNNRPLRIGPVSIELTPAILRVGAEAVEDAVRRMVAKVGTTADITHAFLVGGCAKYFKDAVSASFGTKSIAINTIAPEETHLIGKENVLGFYAVGASYDD